MHCKLQFDCISAKVSISTAKKTKFCLQVLGCQCITSSSDEEIVARFVKFCHVSDTESLKDILVFSSNTTFKNNCIYFSEYQSGDAYFKVFTSKKSIEHFYHWLGLLFSTCNIGTCYTIYRLQKYNYRCFTNVQTVKQLWKKKQFIKIYFFKSD